LWLRPLERIKPGHPQQNGRHEHREPPPGANILHEQAEFDDFIEEFSHQKVNPSTSLAGKAVVVKEVEPGIWLVSLLEYAPFRTFS
jgi:hypothetical protein